MKLLTTILTRGPAKLSNTSFPRTRESIACERDELLDSRVRGNDGRNNSRLNFLRALCVSAAMFFLAGTPHPASAAKLDGIDLPEQYEVRYKALIDQLRCLVCQNETLADSDAELAADLRREIREKMVQGQNDKQITEFLVARYGDFVLYKPPVKPTTVLLWYGPFALLGLGVLIAIITIRRRGHRAPTTLDAEQHRKVQELLRRQDEDQGS